MSQEEKNHFSGVVIGREVNGRAEVLLQPYHYKGQIQMKFPGGMSAPGETPIETARRELEQETYLLAPAGALEGVFEKPVSAVHSKHFFACRFEDVSGDLRTEPIQEGNGGGDEVLMPPEWHEVTPDLLNKIFGSHRPALEGSMGFFAQKFQSFYWAGQKAGLV